MQEIATLKSTGTISAVPFLATFVNCTLWMKYGILLDEFTIYFVNGFGLAVIFTCILFIFIKGLYYYYKYTDDKIAFEKQTAFAFVLVTVILAYVRFFYASGAVWIFSFTIIRMSWIIWDF